MAVTWQTPGTVAQGSASCAPGYPASPGDGDLLFAMVAWGNDTNTPPPTPDGWTAPPNNTYVGGAGSFGVDTGPRGVTFFTRPSDGTETGTLTINNGGTGATRVISAQIGRATKSLADWVVTVVGGSDATSGTDFSVTAGSDPGAVADDLGLAIAVWTPDTATPSSPALTWTGTGTGVISVQSIANANGNDLRFLIYRRALTGTSSAAPTFSATGSAAVSGSTAIVLVHDAAASTVTGSGAAALPSLTAAGAGSVVTSGDGTATLPALSAAGTGTLTTTGAGAATLPAATASGSGIVTTTGSGAATLPALIASGAGTVVVTGAGGATLPSLTASGTATLAASRNVTVTAALSPPRLTAAVAATPYAADTLSARRSAQVAAPRRTADNAPARRTARIEAT